MSNTFQRPGAKTIARLCLAGLTAVACASAPPRASTPPAAAPEPSSVSAAQAAPARAPDDRLWTDFVLGMHPGGGSATAAYIEADLIRRDGGEWVIVSLTSSGSGAGRSGMLPVDSPGAVGTAPADTAEVLEVLREYERAFERRDAVGLARVWIMNPSDRLRVQHLFDSTDAIAVSIRDADVAVDGNRASLAFDQHFVVSSLPRGSGAQFRALRRALAARDSLGTWDLEDVAGTP